MEFNFTFIKVQFCICASSRFAFCVLRFHAYLGRTREQTLETKMIKLTADDHQAQNFKTFYVRNL
jgi:hypothetical protein